MSDVYLLASPAPTLYVYPSALHPQPAPVPGGGGPVWTRNRQPRALRGKGSLRYRITLTAHATITASAPTTVTPRWQVTPASLRSSGATQRALTCQARPAPLRASGRAALVTATRLRTRDHHHLPLSWPLLDLLTESWD